MPLNELPADLEIYQAWSADYVTWHNRHWQPNSYLMHTGVGAETLYFLSVPGRWSIVPWSLLETMQGTHGLVRYTLAETPPPRVYFQITHRSPSARAQRLLPIIEAQVQAYVEALLVAKDAINV